MIGHSAGEIAAAHIAGALTIGEAARIVVARGRAMRPGAGHGKMAAIRVACRRCFPGIGSASRARLGRRHQ